MIKKKIEKKFIEKKKFLKKIFTHDTHITKINL